MLDTAGWTLINTELVMETPQKVVGPLSIAPELPWELGYIHFAGQVLEAPCSFLNGNLHSSYLLCTRRCW
jgi:hypothetical protein